jgi:cellulose synthase/poly-beta-1,6-N-acetylglucosamine synthase-like glycosyltransferase
MHHCPKDVRHGSVRPYVEVNLTRIGIAITLVATFFVSSHALAEIERAFAAGAYATAGVQSLLYAVVILLIYGSLAYQLSRHGYFARLRHHLTPPLTEIWKRLERGAPPVTILVPSYKEDARVVRATLLSAALQCYPNRRVVLLIDDPQNPENDEDAKALADARALPGSIMESLAPPLRRFRAASAEVELRLGQTAHASGDEITELAMLYLEAARWFNDQAASYVVGDHADAFLVHSVFEERATYIRACARALLRRAHSADAIATRDLLGSYRELASIFDVEVTSFERKRYENLSHTPNKAMNLNSYIALAGTRVREVSRDGKLFLEADPRGDEIPDPKYFVTLDADSVLVPEYVLRLVDVMEHPESERVGVIQTPYSAFPQCPGLLEHAAGATTDIQHIVHQGFTEYGATYWVGANAVLRTAALRDIAVVSEERGFPVARFIQDRTVIEDTESSIDLVLRDWTLINHPERLSYSATPSDFGSLLIQRRRWANGGLLIVPKLASHLLRQVRRAFPARKQLFAESFLRLHYLISPATANVGLLLLLGLPCPEGFFTIWLPVSAVPYYVLYARDLLQARYGVVDALRVYALNLLLVPVNVGGVLQSLRQAWTGRPTPFQRTPKVLTRTVPPPSYVLGELALLLVMVGDGGFHLAKGHLLNASFALGNGGFLLYAIVTLVGLPDLCLALRANKRVRTLRRRWREWKTTAAAA